MRRRVTVACVGLVAVAAALWLASRRDDVEGSRPVPRAGVSRVDATPLSAPSLAGVPAAPAVADAPSAQEADGPEDAAPATIRVDTVDALTGAPVPAGWRGTWPSPASSAWQTVQDPSEPGGDARASPSHEEDALRPAGTAVPSTWNRTGDAGGHVYVYPAPGWVFPRHPAYVHARTAAGARHAVVVFPVWREITLIARLFGPDGLPARGARLEVMALENELLHVRSEERAPGEVHVARFPFVPGAHVRGWIEWVPDGSAEPAAESRPAWTESPEETPAPLLTQIPAHASDRWAIDVRLTGPTFEPVEVGVDIAFEEVLGDDGASWADGSVRVKTVDRTGHPLAGAGVLDALTDANGIAVLSGLPAGEHEIRAVAMGHLPAWGRVVVTADEVAELTLHEPQGSRLDVLVEDEEGRPLPFAHLDIDASIVLDATGETQRLDTYVDSAGRRSFARVAPGVLNVTAHWWGRSGSAALTIEDGTPASVRIRVP